MDITIIEDEVSYFCADFFEEATIEVEEGIDFLEDNELEVPKENYTVLPNFLNTIIQRFRVLDSNFVSPLLEKVRKDMRTIQKILIPLKEHSKDIPKLFEEEFIPSSEVLSDLQKDLNDQRIRARGNADLKQRLDESEERYNKLKDIYYEVFSEMFYEDKKYYIESLSLILNSKAFYCDKLLWKEANESNFIKKHFQVQKISTVLNSKNYLLHATSLMRPYTKEYEYYQSCIRIYK